MKTLLLLLLLSPVAAFAETKVTGNELSTPVTVSTASTSVVEMFPAPSTTLACVNSSTFTVIVPTGQTRNILIQYHGAYADNQLGYNLEYGILRAGTNITTLTHINAFDTTGIPDPTHRVYMSVLVERVK